ncbi:MAG TPA: energy transducer TonB [Kofleriaceae bacterium]|jgi:outer membrane biosynthesis protein TonB
MRAWLIGTSLVVHISLIFGLFVAGAWQLDRLDAGKHHVEILMPLPPPPAASGSPTPKAQPFTYKHIVHEVVQRDERIVETPANDLVASTSTGTGTGEGSGSGDDPIGTGACTENCGPGSDAPPVVHNDVKPKLQTTMVPPTVLRGMRISGETQVQASDVVKVQIMRDGKAAVTAMFKVCVDAGGGVSSLARLRGTGYAAYDDQLEAAIHAWRYRPYSANGVAIPVCGVVTFIYDMK